MFRELILLLVTLSIHIIDGGSSDTEVLTLSQNFASNKRPQQHPHYTAHDDISWAINSPNMSNMLKHQKTIYENFMRECMEDDERCEAEEEYRIQRNKGQPSSMVNYTTLGFQKIRAPAPLFALLEQFWEANRDQTTIEHNNEATPYHNSWQVPTTFVGTEKDDLVGGGRNLSAAVWNAARDILEEWTGQKLAGSSVYGIRVYHNQSILTPHVDRLPLSTYFGGATVD